MPWDLVIFYMLAAVCILAAGGVVAASNPVHSAIFLVLCFFNLIPIPPLDGSHLFYYVLPPELGARYRSLQRFGFLLLFALLFLLPGVLNVFLIPAHWIGARLLGLVAPYSLSFL